MESREVLVLELMWEYNCTMEEAEEVVGSYLDNSHYDLLYNALRSKPKGLIRMYEEENYGKPDVLADSF